MEGIDDKRGYTNKETAEKLHRVADAIAAGHSFRIRVNGHRITIPSDAIFEFEFEAHGDRGEMEIEMKWDKAAGS